VNGAADDVGGGRMEELVIGKLGPDSVLERAIEEVPVTEEHSIVSITVGNTSTSEDEKVSTVVEERSVVCTVVAVLTADVRIDGEAVGVMVDIRDDKLAGIATDGDV
jgi:hypothetical protein